MRGASHSAALSSPVSHFHLAPRCCDLRSAMDCIAIATHLRCCPAPLPRRSSRRNYVSQFSRCPIAEKFAHLGPNSEHCGAIRGAWKEEGGTQLWSSSFSRSNRGDRLARDRTRLLKSSFSHSNLADRSSRLSLRLIARNSTGPSSIPVCSGGFGAPRSQSVPALELGGSRPSSGNLFEALMSEAGHARAPTPQAAATTNRSGPGGAPPPPHVIVCGGGVVGCCTAYFLAKKGARVTVVEKTELACAASGKAGGFLALDWCDGSAVEGLARASFALHAQLAAELDGAASYGYRRVDTLSVSVEEPRDAKLAARQASPKAGMPSWIDGSIKGTPSVLGSTSTNGQVHPQLFTRSIFAEAQTRYGASLLIGEVQEVQVENKRVTGVLVDGTAVAADAVVLAMGPWSSRNSLVAALTSISGLKAHSIVLRPKDADAISAHTLFLKYKTREGKSMDPEIYPRATGEVYVCGMSEDAAVPADARDVAPRAESTAMLRRMAATVSSHLADAALEAAQACFLPCSEDNVPVIGKVPDVAGAYVATGHSCWGILNAPATGAALAELIVDGAPTTCSLKAFDPARFVRLRPRFR